MGMDSIVTVPCITLAANVQERKETTSDSRRPHCLKRPNSCYDAHPSNERFVCVSSVVAGFYELRFFLKTTQTAQASTADSLTSDYD